MEVFQIQLTSNKMCKKVKLQDFFVKNCILAVKGIY